MTFSDDRGVSTHRMLPKPMKCIQESLDFCCVVMSVPGICGLLVLQLNSMTLVETRVTREVQRASLPSRTPISRGSYLKPSHLIPYARCFHTTSNSCLIPHRDLNEVTVDVAQPPSQLQLGLVLKLDALGMAYLWRPTSFRAPRGQEIPRS